MTPKLSSAAEFAGRAIGFTIILTVLGALVGVGVKVVQVVWGWL